MLEGRNTAKNENLKQVQDELFKQREELNRLKGLENKFINLKESNKKLGNHNVELCKKLQNIQSDYENLRQEYL